MDTRYSELEIEMSNHTDSWITYLRRDDGLRFGFFSALLFGFAIFGGFWWFRFAFSHFHIPIHNHTVHFDFFRWIWHLIFSGCHWLRLRLPHCGGLGLLILLLEQGLKGHLASWRGGFIEFFFFFGWGYATFNVWLGVFCAFGKHGGRTTLFRGRYAWFGLYILTQSGFLFVLV